jgi:NADH-quinone oxidoreductase subunit L
MTRLFVLTFRGSERFREATNGLDPHESPWVMTMPLVVLAGLSVLGGIINLPWIHQSSLAGFLSSTFGYVAPSAELSSVTQWGLGLVDFVAALLGLVAAFSIWKDKSSDSRFEKEFLEKVWHWDSAYDSVIGRPLTRSAQFAGSFIEPKIIDGAVNGVGRVVKNSGEGASKIQSGFLRHYALAMILSISVIVIYLVSRVG